MKTIILSLSTGISLGAIFAFLRLPIPAPNTISGLFGIIGIFVGYMVMNHFYNSYPIEIIAGLMVLSNS